MGILTMETWTVMWGMALLLFAAGKWASVRAGQLAGLPAARRAAYLLLFPGMSVTEFCFPVSRAGRMRKRAVRFAVNAILGAAVLWGLARLVPAAHPLLRGWAGMIGLVMMLHFGLLQLVSVAWQWAGRRAPLLMNEPWRSKSVMEFWSERWNTAYRELSHRFVYAPMARRFGPRMGVVAAFAVSGLVHELVISVPARGGFGLPMLYFLIQAAGVFVERCALGRGMRRRIFAAAVVIGPVGLLFHPVFVMRVFLPFMGAIGAT